MRAGRSAGRDLDLERTAVERQNLVRHARLGTLWNLDGHQPGLLLLRLRDPNTRAALAWSWRRATAWTAASRTFWAARAFPEAFDRTSTDGAPEMEFFRQ